MVALSVEGAEGGGTQTLVQMLQGELRLVEQAVGGRLQVVGQFLNVCHFRICRFHKKGCHSRGCFEASAGYEV